MSTSTATGKLREPWLDYVRFLSIFLVIAYHTPPRIELLDDGLILNLRLPAFFAVSGLLYSHDRWSGRFVAYLRHRARQLLVPYFVFSLLFYAVYLLWTQAAPRLMGHAPTAANPLEPLSQILTGRPMVLVATFWYITCLMVMQLVFHWMMRLAGRRWVFPLACAMSLSTTLFSWEWPWAKFWNLDLVLLFMPYYAMGHLLRPVAGRITFSRSRPVAVAIVAMAVVSVSCMALIPTLRQGLYPLHYCMRVAMGLLLLPAYFALARLAASRWGRIPVVETAVMGGTVFLALQNHVIVLLAVLQERLGVALPLPGVLAKLLLAALVMAAIYPVAAFIARRMPWVLGRTR